MAKRNSLCNYTLVLSRRALRLVSRSTKKFMEPCSFSISTRFEIFPCNIDNIENTVQQIISRRLPFPVQWLRYRQKELQLSSGESRRIVRTFLWDRRKPFREQNRHFRRRRCIFVLARRQRNGGLQLHRAITQWLHAVKEALGTPRSECRVAVCNGHGMRERKSCELAEIHVRSAEIQQRPA